MRKLLLTLLLTASAALAQLSINSGGPALPGYTSDLTTPCTGLPFVVSPLQPGLPEIYRTLRYASAFGCTYQVPAGTYTITLRFFENRLPNPDIPGYVGPGTRRFSISINGISTGVLDLFTLVGSQVPYSITLTVPAPSGQLILSATSLAGNATLSALEATLQPPPPATIPPLQISEIPQVCGMIVGLQDGTLRCVALGPFLTITPTSGTPALNLTAPMLASWQACCGGISYMAVRRGDGTPAGTFFAVPGPSALPSGPVWVAQP